MNAGAALVFKRVSKSFGNADNKVAALQQVDISVSAGKITGLIGPDGAGKSTLMRLSTGLLLPDEGDINVLDIDVVATPLQVQSSVGYMPQRFGLYEDLTVQENLELYSDLHSIDEQQKQTRYEDLMRMTAMAPFRGRLAGRLSGGMKQKLGLACTLLSTPRLLILDEPTAGVDPVSRRELWAIVNRMVQDEGVSVLVSTAYLDEAAHCDDIVLMHDGRVLDQGTPTYFSQLMSGRSFHVTSTSVSKRQLHQQLSGEPDIIDAVIDNEAVRVVTRSAQPPRISSTDARMTAVEPTFEDAFVALLNEVSATETKTISTTHTISERSNETVIAVNHVEKRFGQFYAVKDISFEVRRGEIFGLLGANGAGKSTTFRMLCGLLPVTAGEVTVAGHDLRRAAAHARSRLGYMAQRFSLYANLSVMENLVFFASVYGLPRRQRQQRIDWAIDAFNLADHINEDSVELPQGYKQRLALAAALLHEPDILFLDEPTSGVDPIARREFWHWINSLAEAGVTVLVTTHFMAEADYCDRLVVMSEGKVLASGTPADLKAAYRSSSRPNPSMEDTFIGLIEKPLAAAGVPA